ncbi:MAG: hypothetical protein K0B09_02245 [Bacteroidales bacterium]|nr:hypothetical protein [Bacteroidales bacterium]
MPAHKPSGKEKTVKEQTGSPDSELGVLLEQMKLKNEALKKIYDFFGKKKKELPDKKDNTR